MKYVEFYDLRNGRGKYLGKITLKKGRLDMSPEMVKRWPRSRAYSMLGKGGYVTMYDPEKILEALPDEFTDPSFKATEVKEG